LNYKSRSEEVRAKMKENKKETPKLIEEAGAEARWEKKQVLKSKTVYDCQTMRSAMFLGVGTFEYSEERTMPGKSPMSMVIKANTNIQDIRPRPSSNISMTFENEDWSEFNRLSVWVYPKSVGFQNFYFHISIWNQAGQALAHAPSLIPNVWNHVFFEMPGFSRDKITRISMGPLMMGCPPEAEPEVKFFFSDVQIEAVEPDYELGWDLQDRIAYCHSGYARNQEKIAITGVSQTGKFALVDEFGKEVFASDCHTISNDYGKFNSMDFSSFKLEGKYRLKTDDRLTPLFEISEFPLKSTILQSLKFLRSLRCGCEVEDVHSPCHLTHHTIHPLDGRLISDNGGWHDAGDVSQYEICTAEMVHALIDLGQKVRSKDKQLAELIFEEAKWGANWLLKTHFGDGFRSLAVLYSIWTSNQIKSGETLKLETESSLKSVAENGPFENFLASAALSATSKAFADSDPVFSKWCQRISKADFGFGLDGHEKGIFTRRWGKGPVAQVSGSLVLAACQLYELTNEPFYLTEAIKHADEIMACQQVDYPNWKKPLRGFFYEDSTHKTLLTYEHRGHEQSPIHALVKLCQLVPDHAKTGAWKNCLDLYKEYILSTSEMIAPYGLLPAHVYESRKINLDRFTIPNRAQIEVAKNNLDRQIKEGMALDDEVFLRRFPIAIQRRGFHATLLSKAKAVSSIGDLFGDEKMKQIAFRQLEWILGKNPFASSTMYGEGHNFHPLYVAFSPQLPGALPVGIETKNDADVPYWPTVNNAVYKEIWGHTTGKFLWVLADLL